MSAIAGIGKKCACWGDQDWQWVLTNILANRSSTVGYQGQALWCACA